MTETKRINWADYYAHKQLLSKPINPYMLTEQGFKESGMLPEFPSNRTVIAPKVLTIITYDKTFVIAKIVNCFKPLAFKGKEFLQSLFDEAIDELYKE